MRRIGGAETVRHVLVDGNNLLRRAQYVFVEDRERQMLPPIRSPSGSPVGLALGTLSLLSSWMYDLASPTKVSAFFDGRPERRLAMDPSYKEKEGREPLDAGGPLSLRSGQTYPDQVALTSEVLRKLGCDTYWHPGEEADDLIASFIKARPGEVHIIVSSDKDFFQLVDDRVVLYRPGTPPPRLYDAERVGDYFERKWKFRLSPGQVRMFKTLTGDASDNIRGVFRIRRKAAATLCGAESVDELSSADARALSRAERANLAGMLDRLRLNWDLVGLKDDVDLPACLTPAAADFAGARAVCDELGIPLDAAPFRIGEHAVRRVAPPVEDFLLGI